MTLADASIDQGLFDRGGGIEQTNCVCNRRTIFAHTLGDRLMRHLEFLGQILVGFGFFDSVQVSALDVFDQREFEQLLIGRVAYDHRNSFQSCFA